MNDTPRTQQPNGFAADGQTPLYTFPGYPLMVRAVDFNALFGKSPPGAALEPLRPTATQDHDSEWEQRWPNAATPAQTEPDGVEPSQRERAMAMMLRRIVSYARRHCAPESEMLRLADQTWAWMIATGLHGSPLRATGDFPHPEQPQQPARVPGQPSRDMVDLEGVRADGQVDPLGQVPMPPRMKAREIAAGQFAEFEDAELCFEALEEFLGWLVAQGWTEQSGTPLVPGLSEQDAGLLDQGASLLEQMSTDERGRGNDSAAMGADCSAHAVRRLGAQLLRAQQQPGVSRAFQDVLAERMRQIAVEGHAPEDDDQLRDGSLARTAAYYAAMGSGNSGNWEPLWVWRVLPKTMERRRYLVCSAALCLAEIERRDRADAQAGR